MIVFSMFGEASLGGFKFSIFIYHIILLIKFGNTIPINIIIIIITT